MNPETIGHLPEPALLGQPHRQRLGQARASAGRERGQRAQAVGGQLLSQSRIAAQQKLARALARDRQLTRPRGQR
jgi:hypothetical protein